MSCICIVTEHGKGSIKKSTFNAITFGREMAEKLGIDLCLLVIGSNVTDIAEQLKPYGAKMILLADDPRLEYCTAETWSQMIAQAAVECNAKIVGMSYGTTARDLMPRVAAKLSAGMASCVIGFDGQCYSREIYAGSVIVEVEILTDIHIVTIQGTHFKPASQEGEESMIEPLTVELAQTRTRFVEMLESETGRPDLNEAKCIVTGGRGLKSAENFKLVEELADLLGGAVGATRAAVDAGWVSNDLQVGQTGKIVAPELYVAVGISGAIQHLAGMKNSRVIVAINKDEEAPIFAVADYGLVTDLFKAVPEMIETIKKNAS